MEEEEGGEVLKGEVAEAHMLANIQGKKCLNIFFHFFLTRLCGKLVVVSYLLFFSLSIR